VVPESAKNLNFAWSGQFQQEGSFFWWIYQYLFSPIVSTMFALLAFYVASAAFRAFRAKNLDAVLLLITALVVLIGQTKDREITSFFLPSNSDGTAMYVPIADLTEFIRKTFVTAGQRAIMIGIALGVVATSLRILLGLDRSYLGGDE
jgi:di/tricarboxylate transporter